MAEPIRVYERERLYEQVWARSVRTVAKDYGVSGVALAKVCKRLQVPLPGRGYWASSEEKRARRRVPLQPLQPGHKDRIEVFAWEPRPASERVEGQADGDEPVEAKEAPPVVPVADTLRSLHRALAGQRKALRVVEGRTHPDMGSGGPDVRVGPASIGRALRILDALLKALDRRGHRVEIKPLQREHGRYLSGSYGRGRTGVHVNDEFVTFGVFEVQRQAKLKQKTPLDYRVTLEETGNLEIRLHGLGSNGLRWRWRDAKVQRLEDALGSVILGIERAAAWMAEKRVRFEAAQRER